MGVYAGPDVSESGLVLALDGANYKSFKGEVTTNLISNPTEEMSRGEFGQYRDLAPIFDSYGLTPYSLSMDIKVNTPGSVLVYMQNGSYSKYNFVGTSVYCTTEYQRFYFQNITPSISTSWQQNTPNDNRAILATYTGYGSGVNPTVKNIQLEQKSYSTLFVNGTRGDTVATGGGWADMSGNGNHGQLINGVRESDDNLGSLDFDGTNDYVTAGALSGSFASFTAIIWFYPTSVTSYENPIDCNYSYNGTTGNIGPRLEMNSSGTLGWIYSNITNSNSSFYTHTVVSSGLAANTWHCAAITYNGGTNTSTTYYNGNASGVSRSTVGSATGFVGVMNNVTIGKGFHLGGAERIFTGRVSNVSIYNRALTASEVQQNFNATRGRYGI